MGGVDEEQVVFCRRAFPQLVGAVALYCGSRDVAEDIAQETLARVCLRWSEVQETEYPMAWAHKVALNLARSWLRRRAAERRAHTRLPRPNEAVQVVETADVVALRAAIVTRLTPRQREALVLRYYADLPIATTARLMRCAPGTVQALTAKALRLLRAELGDPAAVEGPADG